MGKGGTEAGKGMTELGDMDSGCALSMHSCLGHLCNRSPSWSPPIKLNSFSPLDWYDVCRMWVVSREYCLSALRTALISHSLIGLYPIIYDEQNIQAASCAHNILELIKTRRTSRRQARLSRPLKSRHHITGLRDEKGPDSTRTVCRQDPWTHYILISIGVGEEVDRLYRASSCSNLDHVCENIYDTRV